MSAVNLVACTAVDACSGMPVTSTLVKNFGGVNPSAALVNAQSQVTVLARMGEVGTALGRSASKLESLWQLGAAGASAAGAIRDIRGSYGELVGQGTSLAKQIQAAGKLLQSALRIIEFVKAANKAVAALMSTPWSMPAAKALATATAAQTISWIGMIAQMATTIGQALSAVQQATNATDRTTAAVGQALGGGTGTGTAPPAVQAPAVQAPAVQTPAPQAPVARVAGVPTVYESGWVPRGGGGTGGGLTIDIADSDRDGKYEIKVNVPESQLTKDLKINVAAQIGDQEIKGNFDIDV